MSLVQDNATTVTGVRQGNFTCGAVVTSGGTGTGIAQIADGFARQATKTAAFTVPASACGTMYNNIGATGSVTFTLPAAVAWALVWLHGGCGADRGGAWQWH